MPLLFFVITPLFARDVEIIVIDADLDLPLEGAVIRSWDGSAHTCDTDGKAIIHVPEDGHVLIQASYPGYETGRLIITADTDSFYMRLFFSEMLQSQGLVIEASRPSENTTQTGRSIAVSGQDIAQTAKIGAVEDTMASVRLLPGIIATEHFNAMPSIRGGDPQDVNASFNGFYIANPYFWGGAFSIFDPRMIASAQLSHGVFSSRHGHTISGLLDLTSKRPSQSETELEFGSDAGAFKINLSVPVNGKGGILFMGRTTFLIPIFAIVQPLVSMLEIDGEIKDLVNSVNRAPFIRSGTITGNYSFTNSLELSATAFFGADGTGIKYEHSSRIEGLNSYEKLLLDYTRYQGFFTSSLSWIPNNNMLVKFSTGAGFQNNIFEEENMYNIYEKYFSQYFINNYHVLSDLGLVDFNQNYLLTERSFNSNSELIYNIQGRIDYDWYLGKGFLLAFGMQEMIKRLRKSYVQNMRTENWLRDSNDKEAIFISIGLDDPDDPNRFFMEEYIMVSSPFFFNSNVPGNILFNTSGYGLIEYNSPLGRFGSELGLRVDHYYLGGNKISLGTRPVLSPRLNFDLNILRNRSIFDSIDLSVGTGLFSSMPDTILSAEDQFEQNEIKPTRSWTSIIGANLEFPYGVVLNIEGYYKYIFNRMFTPLSYDLDGNSNLKHYFNGEGRSWGIDFLIQKTRARYWDGWISYSYNWTQHRDPSASADVKGFEMSQDTPYHSNEWYYPYYHRFHSLNLVLNVRPVQHINIYLRFGLASGMQLMKRVGSEPKSYPVYLYNSETGSGYFIEKYYWPEVPDQNNRTTPSTQMDMKISFFRTNRKGKTRSEAYFAIENILSLLYTSQGNTVFNHFTGKVATGRTAASYGLPFPIPSFGVNFSY